MIILLFSSIKYLLHSQYLSVDLLCLYSNTELNKGAFKYHIIRLGGVGGLDQNDDNDDAFRGVGGL